MAFGLQVFNAVGGTVLDTNQKITRLIHSRILPRDESGSVTLPDFDASKGVAVTSGLTDSPVAMAHQVSSQGNTITWRATLVDNIGVRSAGTDSLLLVFMYG